MESSPRPDPPTDSLQKPNLPQYMKSRKNLSAHQQSGKIGWILLWLLGIPLPVLLIIYFIKGH